MRQLIRYARFSCMFKVLVTASFILLPASVVAAPFSGESCENIDAIGEGFGIPNFDADGNLLGFDVVATSVLGGTATGSTTVEKITPGGTIHFSGFLSFVDKDFGDFVTTDEGVVTPDGRLKTKLTITEGGPGFITSHGTLDPATGEFQVREHGRIFV